MLHRALERARRAPRTIALALATTIVALPARTSAQGTASWTTWRDAAPALDSLHAADPAPLWLVDCIPTAQARALVRWLARVDSLGLAPRDFDATGNAARLDRLDRERCTAGEAVVRDTDRALSAAAVRAVRALWLGRVNAREAHADLRFPRQVIDRAGFVRGLAATGNVGADLAALEPPFAPYQWLVAALHRYRTLAADTTLAMPRRPATLPLRPGDPYEDAELLRRKLVAVQDLAAGEGSGATYDSALVAAVRRFQRRHGQRADGVIGPATWARLVRPFGQRIRQIELALERFRWLPRSFAGEPILVNLPEFTLYAFRAMGRDTVAADTMNVVIGRAYKSQTPVFTGEMSYLVFSPFWEVPPGIGVREIRPKALRGGAAYLARNDYILASTATGATVPSTAANIARIGRGVRVRQLPGPGNSLGGVKFMFPNEFNVYLHDTPSRRLFEEAQRDYSHGCVRVADPAGLAAFVLRDERGDWTPDAIHAAMTAGRERRVPLARPHPVFIIYATAVPRRDGSVRFLDDVYGLDAELETLLARAPR
ncbi:MAG: L,D-transpeptidase family protein [Gemmatimonadaceae bacterium]|nr:L,D-transpeptidase family protein [Gemmatimonadaceae bacterium]